MKMITRKKLELYKRAIELEELEHNNYDCEREIILALDSVYELTKTLLRTWDISKALAAKNDLVKWLEEFEK